jgi:hypothetical protein
MELAASCGQVATTAPGRYASPRLNCLCPAVSLIGGGRRRAWNFVVVSLWAIVVLPAAETFFLHPGQPVEMGDARGWFLWILILLGPINFVPTRYWPAALLLAGGQVIALGNYLPLIRRDLVVQPEYVGFFVAVAAIVAAWARRLTGAPTGRTSANPYDVLWLDFRDSFGLLWSLRVQERINAAAKQFDWDFDLTWSGFRNRADGKPLTAIDPSVEPTLRTNFKGLLRRFVSHQWIADRHSQGLD